MVEHGVHVIISGEVQGVGYRAWAARKAEEIGLHGWIRNLSDGTVEAVFAGEPAGIAQMLEECESGSRAARVDDIESRELEQEELNDVEEGFYTRSSV